MSVEERNRNISLFKNVSDNINAYLAAITDDESSESTSQTRRPETAKFEVKFPFVETGSTRFLGRPRPRDPPRL